MGEMAEKNRIAYIDALRVFAILGVVMIHVSAIAQRQTADTLTFAMGVFYNSVARWAVPMFFMITGAVFLRPGKSCTFHDMLTKYVRRLACCILVWGMIYAVLDVYLYGAFSVKSVLLCLWNTVANHSGYHLWYLFALIGLYLVMPVFRILVDNLSERQLRYILLLWMVFSLGVSQFNQLTSAVNLPLNVAWYFPAISGWAGYILLGHYLAAYEMGAKTEKLLIWSCAIILPLVCSCLNVALSLCTSGIVDAFISQDGLTAGCAAAGIFLLAKSLSRCPWGERLFDRIGRYGKSVFGIYLVHVLVNSIIFHIIKVSITIIHPAISVPVFTVVVLAVSLVITRLLSKVPVLRKLV